jgi:predicted dienelactone hydrolase
MPTSLRLPLPALWLGLTLLSACGESTASGSTAADATQTIRDVNPPTGGTPAPSDAAVPPTGDAAPPPTGDATRPNADATGPVTDAAAPPPGDASAPGTDGGAPTPDAGAPPETPDPNQPGGPEGDVVNAQFDLAGVQIPLVIYRPAAVAAAPVLVFVHGFQLDPALYASYGRHLATWGYVVVMPRLPGAIFGGPSHRAQADYLIGVLDWLQAAAAGPDGPLAGRVDPERIAMAGHSLGGKLAMLATANDPRPRVVFGVDPVDAPGGPLQPVNDDYPSVAPERMADITVPIGLVGETVNATCQGFGCQACAPEADNFAQYAAAAQTPTYTFEIVGANHVSFLDDPNCGLFCSVCSAGTDAPDVTRRLTQRYLTAFLQVYLAGRPEFATYLRGAELQHDVDLGLVVATQENLP